MSSENTVKQSMQTDYLNKCYHYIAHGINQKRDARYWEETYLKSFFNEQFDHYLKSKKKLQGRLSIFEKFSEKLLPKYQNSKIAILLPVTENPKQREHDVPAVFRTSAELVGLKTKLISTSHVFRSDSRNQFFSLEQAKKRLNDIRDELIDFGPDIILLSINPPLQYLDEGTLNLNFIASIKKEINSKIIGWSGDTINPERWGKLDDWASVCDLLLVSQSAYPLYGYFRNKSIQIPSWTPPSQFFNKGPEKKNDIFFSGSISSDKGLRFAWQPLIAKIIESQKLKHIVSYNYNFIKYNDYLKAMADSKIVIEFSSRSHGYHQVNGRIWEAIGCGSLLLTEDNEEIKNFYIPFVHYVPFKNADELENYISFFCRNEQYRMRIIQEISDWHIQYFKQEKVWNCLLTFLFDERHDIKL